MFEPSIYDKIVHKFEVSTRKFKAPKMRSSLNNTDFSIISNNCWGGITYEGYGLQKQSPTVGTYLFAEDYLKLVKNLKYYMSLKLRMIQAGNAKHKEWIFENGNGGCPIGVLDDIEIIFVHYHTAELAYEKWTRRVARINWNNLIFKFSFMNHATEEHLNIFDSLDLPGKKFMFVNSPKHNYRNGVYYPGFEQDNQIYNDTYYWNRYFDVTAFLNGEGLKNKK